MVQHEMPDTRDPNPSHLPWRVLCEISMASETHARDVMETALSAALESGLAADAVIAENLRQAKTFWTIRESIPLSKRAYATAVNHDIAVPVSQIPAFLIAAETAIRDVAPNAEVIAFGHVGDGNLHYSACEPKDAAQPVLDNVAAQITEIVHTQAMAFGGSISAEHGVGRLKRDELADIRSPAATAAMIAIKKALDPDGIMNPGRVVRTD